LIDVHVAQKLPAGEGLRRLKAKIIGEVTGVCYNELSAKRQN
jgi:hypothetical protein